MLLACLNLLLPLILSPHHSMPCSRPAPCSKMHPAADQGIHADPGKGGRVKSARKAAAGNANLDSPAKPEKVAALQATLPAGAPPLPADLTGRQLGREWGDLWPGVANELRGQTGQSCRAPAVLWVVEGDPLAALAFFSVCCSVVCNCHLLRSFLACRAVQRLRGQVTRGHGAARRRPGGPPPAGAQRQGPAPGVQRPAPASCGAP